METTTTLNKLKEQAEASAFKRLQAEFNKSDQLEQIEQKINRNEKRKVRFIFIFEISIISPKDISEASQEYTCKCLSTKIF